MYRSCNIILLTSIIYIVYLLDFKIYKLLYSRPSVCKYVYGFPLQVVTSQFSFCFQTSFVCMLCRRLFSFQIIQPRTSFLNYLSHLHPNISFTSKQENDGKLPFLDNLLRWLFIPFSASPYHSPLASSPHVIHNPAFLYYFSLVIIFVSSPLGYPFLAFACISSLVSLHRCKHLVINLCFAKSQNFTNPLSHNVAKPKQFSVAAA